MPIPKDAKPVSVGMGKMQILLEGGYVTLRFTTVTGEILSADLDAAESQYVGAHLVLAGKKLETEQAEAAANA